MSLMAVAEIVGRSGVLNEQSIILNSNERRISDDHNEVTKSYSSYLTSVSLSFICMKGLHPYNNI